MNFLMSDQKLRLEALRLAVEIRHPDLRDQFYDFLKGEKGKSPREQSHAATR